MRTTLARGIEHFSYTPLLALAAFFAFAKLIVYARLVGVGEFGSLSKILLVSTVFGLVSSLGLQSVASRELPALFARGRVRRGLHLLGRTLGVTAVIGVACGVAAAAGLTLFGMSAREIGLGVLHGWVQQAFLTMAFESRSRLEMMRYARDMLVRNAAIAVGGAAAAALGAGASGVALTEALLTLVLFGLLAHAAAARAGTRAWWFVRALRPARRALPWRSALVLLAGTAVLFASFNLDRWIAAETLAREPFGQYAFAWLALVAAQSVQGLLNSGLMPLLARRCAEALEASAFRLTWLMSCALLAGGLLLVLPAGWATAGVVERWLPQYAAAVPLLTPLLFAAVLRVADFWSSLLVVLAREALLLAGQLGAVVVAGGAYVAWLIANAAAPTPQSLAWLALATAILSHAASAVSVLALGPRGGNGAPPAV